MSSFVDMHRRVLAFGAHPDDAEVGAGGLLARLAGAGARVTLVVTSIPNQPELRLAECRAAAAVLGVELELALGTGTSRIEDVAVHELVARFDRIVAAAAPDLVITHGENDLHWDHVLVHRASISALRRNRCDVLAYTAGPSLGVQTRTVGPCFADISATIDAKLAAIAAHATQFSPAAVAARRDFARATGLLCGAAYAESFEVLRLGI